MSSRVGFGVQGLVFRGCDSWSGLGRLQNALRCMQMQKLRPLSDEQQSSSMLFFGGFEV